MVRECSQPLASLSVLCVVGWLNEITAEQVGAGTTSRLHRRSVDARVERPPGQRPPAPRQGSSR